MKKILLILTLIILTACGKAAANEVEKKEVQKVVESVELEITKEKNIKNYNGELLPLNEVKHITDTGGNVTKVNYKNGEKVKEGDVVVVLEDSDTKSAYLEARGDLTKTQSDYNTKKTSYDKYKTLFDKAFVSEDAYLTVKNQLSESKGNLEIANAAYIKAKREYDDLTITAKISGTITDFDLKVYEKTMADQNLFTVIDTNQMEVAIGVSSDDITQIGVGTEANLFVGSTEVSGTVEKINYNSNKDTKTYETKIVIDNTDGKLLKGMYSKVNITIGEVEGYFVPKEAVMIKDMYNYVAVSRDGKAVIYKVDLGIVNGNNQQIFLEQVEEGDRVVIQGQYLLNNNDNLKEA